MKKFIESITKNPKRAIAFAVVIVVFVLIIYFFGKKFIDFIKSSFEESREKKEEKELIEAGGGGSFTKSEYKNMAESIYGKAGTWIWDDEDGIVLIFKRLESNADFLLLKRAWNDGERDNYSLPEFIVRFLSANHVKQINQHFENVGITYLF